MQGVLDYISSVAVGGMVFFSLVAFYGQIKESDVRQVLSSAVQAECTSATEVLEYDFRRVGFGASDTVKVVSADTTGVCFVADIDLNGIVDTIRYYMSSTPVVGASNAKTRVLHRLVNGTDTPLLTGVTGFHLKYYDRTGAVTVVPSAVCVIDVRLTLESDAAVDSLYPGVVWNRTFKPNNLR